MGDALSRRISHGAESETYEMITEKRIQKAFEMSRKLEGVSTNKNQMENIRNRLNQIFTEEELQKMDDKQFMYQVERVWPIAQYIDKEKQNSLL